AAASGAEAIARCRKRAYRAVTLDLLLPDIGGWEVLAEIRASELNRNVPAVVVTVVSDQRRMGGFLVDGFLVKPIDSKVLLDTLRRASTPPSAGGPIAIVDDARERLVSVERALRGLGHAPVFAADGEAALPVVAELSPVAVIVDLHTPGMDAF